MSRHPSSDESTTSSEGGKNSNGRKSSMSLLSNSTASTGGDSQRKSSIIMPFREMHKRRSHNEVERKRKDKISGSIFRLGEHLPDRDPKKMSKYSIVERACDYIVYLRETNDKLLSGRIADAHVDIFRRMRAQIRSLEAINSQYVKLLTKAGIPLSSTLDQVWDRKVEKYSSKHQHPDRQRALVDFAEKILEKEKQHEESAATLTTTTVPTAVVATVPSVVSGGNATTIMVSAAPQSIAAPQLITAASNLIAASQQRVVSQPVIYINEQGVPVLQNVVTVQQAPSLQLTSMFSPFLSSQSLLNSATPLLQMSAGMPQIISLPAASATAATPQLISIPNQPVVSVANTAIGPSVQIASVIPAAAQQQPQQATATAPVVAVSTAAPLTTTTVVTSALQTISTPAEQVTVTSGSALAVSAVETSANSVSILKPALNVSAGSTKTSDHTVTTSRPCPPIRPKQTSDKEPLKSIASKRTEPSGNKDSSSVSSTSPTKRPRTDPLLQQPMSDILAQATESIFESPQKNSNVATDTSKPVSEGALSASASMPTSTATMTSNTVSAVSSGLVMSYSMPNTPAPILCSTPVEQVTPPTASTAVLPSSVARSLTSSDSIPARRHSDPEHSMSSCSMIASSNVTMSTRQSIPIPPNTSVSSCVSSQKQLSSKAPDLSSGPVMWRTTSNLNSDITSTNKQASQDKQSSFFGRVSPDLPLLLNLHEEEQANASFPTLSPGEQLERELSSKTIDQAALDDSIISSLEKNSMSTSGSCHNSVTSIANTVPVSTRTSAISHQPSFVTHKEPNISIEKPPPSPCRMLSPSEARTSTASPYSGITSRLPGPCALRHPVINSFNSSASHMYNLSSPFQRNEQVNNQYNFMSSSYSAEALIGPPMHVPSTSDMSGSLRPVISYSAESLIQPGCHSKKDKFSDVSSSGALSSSNYISKHTSSNSYQTRPPTTVSSTRTLTHQNPTSYSVQRSCQSSVTSEAVYSRTAKDHQQEYSQGSYPGFNQQPLQSAMPYPQRSSSRSSSQSNCMSFHSSQQMAPQSQIASCYLQPAPISSPHSSAKICDFGGQQSSQHPILPSFGSSQSTSSVSCTVSSPLGSNRLDESKSVEKQKVSYKSSSSSASKKQKTTVSSDTLENAYQRKPNFFGDFCSSPRLDLQRSTTADPYLSCSRGGAAPTAWSHSSSKMATPSQEIVTTDSGCYPTFFRPQSCSSTMSSTSRNTPLNINFQAPPTFGSLPAPPTTSRSSSSATTCQPTAGMHGPPPHHVPNFNLSNILPDFTTSDHPLKLPSLGESTSTSVNHRPTTTHHHHPAPPIYPPNTPFNPMLPPPPHHQNFAPPHHASHHSSTFPNMMPPPPLNFPGVHDP